MLLLFLVVCDLTEDSHFIGFFEVLETICGLGEGLHRLLFFELLDPEFLPIGYIGLPLDHGPLNGRFTVVHLFLWSDDNGIVRNYLFPQIFHFLLLFNRNKIFAVSLLIFK